MAGVFFFFPPLVVPNPRNEFITSMFRSSTINQPLFVRLWNKHRRIRRALAGMEDAEGTQPHPIVLSDSGDEDVVEEGEGGEKVAEDDFYTLFRESNSTVRNKMTRDDLVGATRGFTCVDCEKFFKALGPGVLSPELVKRCSRHRCDKRETTPKNFGGRTTPPGYWDLDFATTEEEDREADEEDERRRRRIFG